jgi:hypothetical protein
MIGYIAVSKCCSKKGFCNFIAVLDNYLGILMETAVYKT